MSEKLTQNQFRKDANTYLGVDLRNLLGNAPLKVDEEGFILKDVLKNIKISLRAAIIMTDDNDMRLKCQKFLDFLNRMK
jgi:hypothetical protein